MLFAKLASIPQSLIMRVATHALCIFIGMAIANSWATRAALEVQADAASKREADVGAALIEQRKADNARLQKAHDDEMRAANAAYAVLEKGMEEAEESADRARAQLAAEFKKNEQLAENVDDLKMVNKMLAEEFTVPEPTSGCNMPVGVRRAIDSYIASINNRPAFGGAEAPSAGVPFSPNPTDQILTCVQLADGLIETLDHDAMLTAWLLSWQQWAREALQ